MGTGSGEHREVMLVAGNVRVPGALREELQLLAAIDGFATIEAARSQRPALLLLGTELTDPGVLEVLRYLRRDERTSRLATVVQLGPHDGPQLELAALEAGADEVLGAAMPEELRVARVLRVLRESQERTFLLDAAQTDALTGLANFRALTRRLHEEFTRANRYHYPLTAVMIDLDHLKPLNDRLGHEAGNQAIAAIGRHLRANLRETDFAARYGGDEFVVLLPHQTPQEAEIFAHRLRASLRALAPEAPGLPALTVSVGIAGHTQLTPRGGPGELLQAADGALYEAKRRGRNQIIVAEEALDSSAWDS